MEVSQKTVENTSEHPNKSESSDTNGIKRKGSTDSEESNNIKKVAQAANDEKKSANLRKNIRDVLDENQLDSTTLAAQREESERLARVNEQQKVIREYQRQTAVNKQVARTQSKVLSLLQSGTTFAKETDLTTCYAAPEIEQEKQGIIDTRDVILDEDDVPKDISSSDPSKESGAPCEIVTIEDSSDDDCILLSDEEIDESIPEEEDDANNSGMHVKDVYNVPDELGRVVVNIGHPEDEEDIFVAPQIAKTIKPHQIGGVRFLFDNIVESTNRFKSSSGFGCILAHSMGLGKTLQVVCFCDLFMRHTPSKTILCVMPINTIQNWLSEFNMWTPRHSEDEEKVRPRTFDVFVLNDQQKTLSARGKVIKKWAQEGGVLLIGYELFRLLALKLTTNRRRRNKGNANNSNTETTQNKNLYDDIHQALVKPGPDLVICDEGHRIKNSHAGISLALKQIRTRRRIVLTGYPLQNNLLEYWCMVDFVRPNYLGTRTEFCNMFERPIQNGQCIDSTPGDIKLMRYRAHVLHSLLLGFVQRRSHVVLQETLPEKQEYVILTKMTKFQRELYKSFMTNVVISKVCPNPLKAFAVCCKIWNHPDVLYNFLKKRQADLDLEIDEVVPEEQTATTPEKPSVPTDVSLATVNNKEISTEVNKEVSTEINVKTEPQNECHTSQSTNNNTSFNVGNSSKGTFFGDDYLQHYSSTVNEFWKYSSVPYDPCASIHYSTKPNYVGTVKESITTKNAVEENLNNSSEIVDLDTQEIKTVSTNVNMNRTSFLETSLAESKKDLKSPEQISKTVSSSDADNAKVENGEEKDDVKQKNEESLPYDWAKDLMVNYTPGLIENSPKMEIVFFILKTSIEIGDRILLFSQSLLTLNLIEQFLEANDIPNTNVRWSKGTSYFRLDGSTSAQDREKLVNEFNSNINVKLFLISTRAGSLGINLIGANRVIIFDASWNPCHDTQAVYRVYRFGQKKPCYIYRLVMDRCLEKKIYDRQIKKQGMSNRVVDECNPESHLSIKDVTNLCHNNESDLDDNDEAFTQLIEEYGDDVVQKIVDLFKNLLSKEPFHHESLLLDRKERKLSQAEKRLAHRGYEAEKKSISQKSSFLPNKVQYRIVRPDGTYTTKPTASVRPMQTMKTSYRSTRWIPAEVWQRQGMTAQEMTLPLDVVIPTNSSDKTNIILKAGQRVMVLKSTKGIYMQLESGKIIAIRTTSKTTESAATSEAKGDKGEVIDITSDGDPNLESKGAPQVTNEKNENIMLDGSGDGNKGDSGISSYPGSNESIARMHDLSNEPTNLENTQKISGTFINSKTQNMWDGNGSTTDSVSYSSPHSWTKKSHLLYNKPNNSWQGSTDSQDGKSNSTQNSYEGSDYWPSASPRTASKSYGHPTIVQRSSSYNESAKTTDRRSKTVEPLINNHTHKEESHLEANPTSDNSNSRTIAPNSGSSSVEALENIGDQSMQSHLQQYAPCNKESGKSYDYSVFNKQFPSGLYKPPAYVPHHNSHRFSYNHAPTTLPNVGPPVSDPNNPSSYLPESNYNNFPVNFYDNYSSNAFMDHSNQHHRPYVDYSNYASYNNPHYQTNYSEPSSGHNTESSTSLSSAPASTPASSSNNTSFKHYNFAWPNLNVPLASNDVGIPNYTSSNYSTSREPNRWPH